MKSFLLLLLMATKWTQADIEARTKPSPSLVVGVNSLSKVRHKRTVELKKDTLTQQLTTSAVMDAVACFSMDERFTYCEYDINRIVTKHISGAIVTITFK